MKRGKIMNKKLLKKIFNSLFFILTSSLVLAACGETSSEEEVDEEVIAEEIQTEEILLNEQEALLVTEVQPYGEVVGYILIKLPAEIESDLTNDTFTVEKVTDEGSVERIITEVSIINGTIIGETDEDLYLSIELDNEQEEAGTLHYNIEEEYNVRQESSYSVQLNDSIELQGGVVINETEDPVIVEEEYQMVVDDFEHGVFTPTSGEDLDYYLFDPGVEGEELPLVLFLHGNGERGEGNKVNLLGNEGAVVWARPDQQESYPAFVLAPQAPIDGDEFYIWGAEPRNTSVKELLEEIIEQYPVDQDRIYVTGISMGAIGTWRLVEKYNHLFAAAMTMAGTTNFENIDEETNIAPVNEDLLEEYFSIPTWSFHAADDFVVMPDNIRQLAESAEELGIDYFHYTEYEAETVFPIGHFSWVPALQDQEMIEWLFSQRRE